MGLVGFGLGVFFGWLLHRERVARGLDPSAAQGGDQATTALADASARLELADQDAVDLRAQLSEAQLQLDERAAIITELETELAEHRGQPAEEYLDEEVIAEAVAGEAAGTSPAFDDVYVEEIDVTEEVVAPTTAVEEDVEEPAQVEEPVEDVVPEDVPAADAEPDDMRRIRGIGPAMETLLNEQGIVTFRQLALLDDAGIKELEARLPGVPGRIRRDRWVDQARDLHVQTHGDQP
jgi:predicted flap endonuclease-1-like 5' DNA nuclease